MYETKITHVLLTFYAYFTYEAKSICELQTNTGKLKTLVLKSQINIMLIITVINWCNCSKDNRLSSFDILCKTAKSFV